VAMAATSSSEPSWSAGSKTIVVIIRSITNASSG
jgi:hypothetical protein